MFRGFNVVFLAGVCCTEPRLSRSKMSGRPMAHFRLVTRHVYKRATGGLVTDDDFHDVIVWGNLAQTVSDWAQVGTRVEVLGRLKSRRWKDVHGVIQRTAEVWVTEINFISKSKRPIAPGHERVSRPRGASREIESTMPRPADSVAADGPRTDEEAIDALRAAGSATPLPAMPDDHAGPEDEPQEEEPIHDEP